MFIGSLTASSKNQIKPRRMTPPFLLTLASSVSLEVSSAIRHPLPPHRHDQTVESPPPGQSPASPPLGSLTDLSSLLSHGLAPMTWPCSSPPLGTGLRPSARCQRSGVTDLVSTGSAGTGIVLRVRWLHTGGLLLRRVLAVNRIDLRGSEYTGANALL
jgi:hypothetical protein